MSETLARLLFAAIWLPFAAMRIHYHRGAGAKPKGMNTPEEGRLFGLMRCVPRPSSRCSACWCGWSIHLHSDSPPSTLPAGWRWAGAVLFATGALLVFWTNRNLGPNFSSTLILRDGHELIERGPYRWVRHPMYTAFVIMSTGMLLLSANWLIGGGPLLFLPVLMLVRTPREERMLLARFGDDYRAYMARTGRYLPRLRA